VNDITVIHLVNGGFTIVDADLFPELNQERWFRNSGGYTVRQWTRQGLHGDEKLHNRVNRTPKGFIGDHINRCRCDNTRRNLRTVTKSLNALNQDAKGVSFHPASGLWRARLNFNGKETTHYFSTESEAKADRQKMVDAEFEKFAEELKRIQTVYEPPVKLPKHARKSIPMTREECVDGDIARIPLLRGGHAIIDVDLFDELSKIPWRRSDSNHVAAWVSGKYLYLHQAVHKPADGVIVDHINRNPLDNRRCNLRDSNDRLNRGNIEKFDGDYTSEFKGVSWHKLSKKWIARIRIDGTLKHLGYFRSEIQAMCEYNKAAKAAFGEFACLNVLR